MGKPKKRTSSRRTGTRRSRLVVMLARVVNGKSPVKAFTTTRESGKALKAEMAAVTAKPAVVKSAKAKKTAKAVKAA